MCNFVSTITMRPIGDAPIIVHDCTPFENSHSKTEAALGLKPSRDANWAKCEFTPPTGVAMFDIENWTFKIDEERTPDWWTPEIESETIRVSRGIAKNAIVNEWTGSLYLRGCDLNGITLPQTVGGSLDLSGCDLNGITLPQTVGGSLDLSGCDLKGITLPQTGGGSLYLRGCDLNGITLPQTVGGSLDLRGCDLNGITLPQTVGGWLYLSGCDLKGITLPQTVGGSLDLRGCDLKGITLPDMFAEKVIR